MSSSVLKQGQYSSNVSVGDARWAFVWIKDSNLLGKFLELTGWKYYKRRRLCPWRAAGYGFIQKLSSTAWPAVSHAS